jgi:hypothetical protein
MHLVNIVAGFPQEEFEALGRSLPHVEFIYNRAVHSNTKFSPLEIVYGFKPAAPIDLLPLLMQERVNFDASKCVEFFKKLHGRAKSNIEKMTKMYEKHANKGGKKIVFEQGDLVGVHLRKDQFPDQHKSKLQPCVDGPFKVLRKINDNAYEIDLPRTYGVSTSFNIADLSPFFGVEESMMTPFQEGEDDVDIPQVTQDQVSGTQAQVIQGPIICSRAKKLQQQVNSFLAKINFEIHENVILPKSCTSVVFRNIHEEDSTTKHGEAVNNKKQSNQESQAQTKDTGEFRSDDYLDKPRNQE